MAHQFTFFIFFLGHHQGIARQKSQHKEHLFAFVCALGLFLYFVKNSWLLGFLLAASPAILIVPFSSTLNFLPFASSRRRNMSTFFPKRIVLLFFHSRHNGGPFIRRLPITHPSSEAGFLFFSSLQIFSWWTIINYEAKDLFTLRL